ncbi:hypothetical protein ACET3Z_021892 [Daucus carota]
MSLVSSVRLNLVTLGRSKILMLLFPFLTSHREACQLSSSIPRQLRSFVITNGAGQLEMACPHLAQEQQGQGEQDRGGFQEGQ